MLLTDLVHQLNTELRITEIPDYPPALNGLQVDAPGMTVRKIATAVDATLHTIRRAIEQQADLLIVHHGLFWNGQQPITAATYEKLRLCIQHPLAIYSSYFSLDVHPSLGNNACIV
jgi:putative NIF3 family GTP cyclohydrolase 1 type 2